MAREYNVVPPVSAAGSARDRRQSVALSQHEPARMYSRLACADFAFSHAAQPQLQGHQPGGSYLDYLHHVFIVQKRRKGWVRAACVPPYMTVAKPLTQPTCVPPRLAGVRRSARRHVRGYAQTNDARVSCSAACGQPRPPPHAFCAHTCPSARLVPQLEPLRSARYVRVPRPRARAAERVSHCHCALCMYPLRPTARSRAGATRYFWVVAYVRAPDA
ncbi:hypothetical protein EON67_01435 [archaeon]|nr:MAG: hypothetical protein EON67_01435 [archaeon]